MKAYANPTDRGRLRANIVSSVDGAAVLEGRVGALTGPADQQLLVLLRSLCDVLLVGAGTLRAEGYGPVRAQPALSDVRREAGQRPLPGSPYSVAAWTSTSLLRVHEAAARPIVITTEARRLRARS